MALQYCHISIRAVRKGVVDIEQNESSKWVQIDTVPLIWCMGRGTEGLWRKREEFEVEDNGIAIHTQVRRLVKPPTMREWRLHREIAMGLAVFVVQGRKMVQSLTENGITAAGVWYRVEAFPNTGPDSSCQLY